MKQVLFFLIGITFLGLCSCSKEPTVTEKGESLIKDYLFKSAHDFDSYQPIETHCDTTPGRLNDMFNIEIIKMDETIQQEYFSKTSGNSLNKELLYHIILGNSHKIQNYKQLETEDNIAPYKLYHSYRIKGRYGVMQLEETVFMVDKDFTKIVYHYPAKNESSTPSLLDINNLVVSLYVDLKQNEWYNNLGKQKEIPYENVISALNNME